MIMPNEKKTITQIKRTLESVVGNELIPGRDENGDFKIEIQKLLLGFENYISETPAPEVVPKSKSNSKLDNGWLADDIRGYEHTVDPIAYYTEHTEDYELKVGEVAKINFDVTGSPYQVPLRIKTMDGTYYEFHLIPANTGGTSGSGDIIIGLLANNTTYTEKFHMVIIARSTNSISDAYIKYDYFYMGRYYSSIQCFITNKTVYKNVRGHHDRYGYTAAYPVLSLFSTDWRDTTTEWTSLGTVQFGQATKGTILIRRLL